MIIIAIVISIFFIVVIAMLCRSYIKDIFELENRLLQLEKRNNDIKNELKNYDRYIESELRTAKLRLYFEEMKEGEDTMACKKGRGGKKK